MDYSVLINKTIRNKNGQEGIVVAFNNEHIVVRYSNVEKTYNPDVAFKNGFLCFVDEPLNKLMFEETADKENKRLQREQEFENNNKAAVKRVNQINKTYKTLLKKSRMMQSLFGSDFEYPPLVEFIKKYRLFINKEKGLFDNHYYIYY